MHFHYWSLFRGRKCEQETPKWCWDIWYCFLHWFSIKQHHYLPTSQQEDDHISSSIYPISSSRKLLHAHFAYQLLLNIPSPCLQHLLLSRSFVPFPRLEGCFSVERSNAVIINLKRLEYTCPFWCTYGHRLLFLMSRAGRIFMITCWELFRILITSRCVLHWEWKRALPSNLIVGIDAV